MSLNALNPIPVKLYVAFFFVCLLSINLNAQTIDTQNIEALIEETDSKQKEFSAKLQSYKYISKRIEQKLNGTNKESEKVSIYQAFPGPDGVPIWMLLSENGKDLSPKQLVKEKKRVNKVWEKAKQEVAKRKVKNTTEEPVSFFRASDFKLLRMDRLNGREMVVLSFTPKPVKPSQEFMSQVEGEVWIDLKDKSVARVDGKLSERYKVGGGFLFPAYLKPGTSIIIENAPLSNGLWATTRVEFIPVPQSSLVLKIHSTRQREERSDYVPFDQSVDKLFPEL